MTAFEILLKKQHRESLSRTKVEECLKKTPSSTEITVMCKELKDRMDIIYLYKHIPNNPIDLEYLEFNQSVETLYGIAAKTPTMKDSDINAQ